jgi:hypothetical protein
MPQLPTPRARYVFLNTHQSTTMLLYYTPYSGTVYSMSCHIDSKR